jgi:hypothetical protein
MAHLYREIFGRLMKALETGSSSRNWRVDLRDPRYRRSGAVGRLSAALRARYSTSWTTLRVPGSTSITRSGINLVTTVLKLRTKGMTYLRMPMFCWTTLARVAKRAAVMLSYVNRQVGFGTLLAARHCFPARVAGDEEFGMKANLLALFGLLLLPTGIALARDDGRYANSPLKPWFESLRSGRGLCCSGADGVVVSDPDWDSKDGHYRVRLDGEWLTVPDEAVVTEPNRAGRTMVWPVRGALGTTVRCFLPGTMS